MTGSLAVAVVAVLLSVPAAADAQAQIPASIEFRVPKPPTVATGDSGSFLAYELHVTNLTSAVMALRSVEVMSGVDTGRSLLALRDSALLRVISRAGANIPASERAQLGAGMRAIVYLWVLVDKSSRPPSLRHRLTFARMTPDSATQALVTRDTQMLTGALVPVERKAARISAPLRGRWLAANGPSNVSGHRRLALALNGTTTVPQRFGIDFLQVDDSGNTFKGDRSKNENFYAHGEEALAVANGRVVQTKDSIPENTGGPQSRAVPVTLETVGGNHIVIDIGQGKYAFYAHLQPGSLRVRVGDRVRRGQVIGLVGNSGNSTEPHLHFHVVDAIAPGTSTLGAEGVPYALPSFDLIGRCQLSSSRIQCSRGDATTLKEAMPLQNQLVRLPE